MIEMSMYTPGRKKYYIAAALISLALIAGGVTLKMRTSKPPVVAAKTAAALTVTAASPHRANWSTTLEVPGAIAPWQEAIVSAQISGYQITEVLVNVGDQVKKGQVLARINQALLRADEALAVANYEQADANHQRAIALKTNGFISDQNILQLETQVKTTKALLDAKRLQIRYTDVVAPDDGAVSARAATVGSVANTGQELFRLVRQNRLEWRGELSAKQIAQIQPGQAVNLALPSGAKATAVVRQTSPTLNTDSRLGLVYADIAADSEARAGMYAVGRIAIGEAPALVVPAEAVVLRDGRSYVLELGETSAADNSTKVILRAVDVGRREGQEVEVVSGLSDGARLAVRGSGFLNDGDAVRVVEPVSSSRGALH